MDNESDAFLQLRFLCNSEVKILNAFEDWLTYLVIKMYEEKNNFLQTTPLAKSTNDYTTANA